ncbi:MAG: hypothetical protein GY950_19300 [bacterium]|nr:hypothetical protein [bacterium]
MIVPDMGRLHYFDKKDGKFVKTEVLGTMGLMPRMFIDSGSFLFVPDNQGKQEGKDSLMRYDLASKKRVPVVEVGTEKPMNLSGSAGGGQMIIKVIDPATKPGVVQFLKNNKLYYGKSDVYKIKAIDLKGTEFLSFSLEGRERRKISQAFKKKRTARFKINGGPLPPEMAKQMMARIPDQATYFNRLLVDDKGYVYVFISDVENENSQVIDIFSPKGEFLYRSQIAAPEDYSFNGRGFVLKGDHLYVVLRDEEEELSLAKFKINSL